MPCVNALYDVNVFSDRLGRNVSLRDVCLTPIPNGPCMVQSAMDFFLNNYTLVQERAASIKRDVSVAAVHPIGFTLSRGGLLGGLEFRNGSTIVSKATGFKIEIILNTSFAGFTGPQRLNPLLVEWNARAIAAVEQLRTNGTLATLRRRMSILTRCLSARSWPSSPTRFRRSPSALASFSSSPSINLGQCSPRCETRIAIALCTAVSVGLTVAAALGLPALGNVPVTSVTAQVVPMLVYSIGVDNVFIVVKTFYSPSATRSAASAARAPQSTSTRSLRRTPRSARRSSRLHARCLQSSSFAACSRRRPQSPTSATRSRSRSSPIWSLSLSRYLASVSSMRVCGTVASQRLSFQPRKCRRAQQAEN
jgi:hypothetical protein